jgi:branched-chain amino acid transport system ATP-binding protein
MNTVRTILWVEHLVAGYEPGAPIVNGVSIAASRGEIVAVLGPNGAGKSTLVKAIAGLVPVAAGHIHLDGEDITARPAHTMVRGGLAFVPQTENIFGTLSVADNLKLAAHLLAAPQRAVRINEVYGIFPDLARQQRLAAGRLSGGQRQMLAVARALIVSPKVLLLDEPSAGLSPKAVDELFRKLLEISHSGVAVVLVEQNVRAALAIAGRLYVLVEGRNRLEGLSHELAADPAMAALYLGGAAAREAAAHAGGAHVAP